MTEVGRVDLAGITRVPEKWVVRSTECFPLGAPTFGSDSNSIIRCVSNCCMENRGVRFRNKIQ
jgi:hypothetical protein